MNVLKKTQETYQQIASDYAQVNQERSLLDAQIEQFVALLPKGGLVVDVGCGPGWDTAVFQSHHLTPIGLDLNHEMMCVGRDECGILSSMVQADMRHLPFAGKIDGIWACASLLHLEREDVLPTLREFHRVLKPDGVVYLSVKLGSGEEWTPMSYNRSLSRFFAYWQPETLDPLLETAAFHIIDGWEEQGRRDTWLVRYARKCARKKEP